MTNSPTNRKDALERMTAAFGPPLVMAVREGEIYRWVRERPHGINVYLTLDAPELPEMAHLMVSDPRAKLNPIQSIVVRTTGELDALIGQIREQWKAP